jgi:hypothetical protein
MRAMISMVLPAAKGTTARMILSLGHASAKARRPSAGAMIAAQASVRTRRRLFRAMKASSAHCKTPGSNRKMSYPTDQYASIRWACSRRNKRRHRAS